jgi:hypothetical protein
MKLYDIPNRSGFNFAPENNSRDTFPLILVVGRLIISIDERFSYIFHDRQ